MVQEDVCSGLSGTGEGWHRLMLQEERLVLWE